MAKLKVPLLSLKAVGSITDFLTFDHRRRTHIVEKKPIPTDARSAAQLPWRHMFQKATALWLALSATEKQEWETLARRKRMTGYAWFISQALKPNPGLYLPLQGGSMQGTIDMVTHRILHLPAPIEDEEPARKMDLGAGGTFIGLTDTPASYTGQASKAPLVNPAEDALIFQVLAYLALAGGTMAGPIAMAANKITGLADPTAAQDAATAAYVLTRLADEAAIRATNDTTEANTRATADLLRLLLTGGTMSGPIAMAANKITTLADPTAAQDAATKTYVDTKPAPYTQGAKVYHSAAQSIPSGTMVTLAWDSEEYDTDTIHDPAANNSRLTCKTAGKYLIIAHNVYATNTTGDRIAGLCKNGGGVSESRIGSSKTGSCAVFATVIFNLAVTDYMEAYAYQDSDVALNVTTASRFTMQRIG